MAKNSFDQFSKLLLEEFLAPFGTVQSSLEITGQAAADEELMMVLSQAYLEWEQQTEQRGEQRGLQRERSLIFRLLARRIGELTPETRSQFECLSLEHLELLGEALLDFSSAADLENWLRSR